MVERVQNIVDPWQESIGDPWSRRKAKQEEAHERGCEDSDRDHGCRGFRLVSEKDLSVTIPEIPITKFMI